MLELLHELGKVDGVDLQLTAVNGYIFKGIEYTCGVELSIVISFAQLSALSPYFAPRGRKRRHRKNYLPSLKLKIGSFN